jgi:hypothetical protein
MHRKADEEAIAVFYGLRGERRGAPTEARAAGEDF